MINDKTSLDYKLGSNNYSLMSIEENESTLTEANLVPEATKNGDKTPTTVTVEGVTVTRNSLDDSITAVALYKIAGLKDEAIQEKVNELERNQQVVSQRDNQVWVSFDQALQIAKELDIEKSLQPLLHSKPVLARTFSTITDNDEYDTTETSPNKKQKTQSIIKYALPPKDISHISNYDQLKQMITQIFVSEQQNISQACKQLANSNVDLDLPIDNQGHTVLHWAASLALISLVRELVELGADLSRGNNSGETALMRAVSHTNFLDYMTFGELLDIFYPAIIIVDNKHRSLLHHIMLTAGIEGRSDAAKYYLQCLVEWIIRSGSSKPDGISLATFMKEIVNLKDSNGDTALNIIARIGNKAIAQQLLDIGADPKIPNRAGLTPLDFRLNGLNMLAGSAVKAQDTNGSVNEQLSLLLSNNTKDSTKLLEAMENNSDSKEVNKTILITSKNIIQSMNETMQKLNGNFESEIQEKQKEINDLYKSLKQSTIKLSESRAKLEILKNSESKLNELKQKTANIEQSIQEEETTFNSQYPETASQTFEANTLYDPDQPFKVAQIYYEVKAQIDEGQEPNIVLTNVNIDDLPPNYVLKARIRAYKENETFLQSLADNLEKKSTVLKEKFRHVVSLCTGVEETKVDDLLEGLVQAVESDPDEVDLGRVAGFLTKVDENI